MREEASFWLCLPDGSVVWQPTPEDYALWREEERDLLPEDDD